MPFTPFHLGPGAAFKAVGGQHFSFMVFGGTQVLMDIEPLVGIIQHKAILHGYSHTLAGATVIACAAAVIGKPISGFALKLLHIKHHPFTWHAVFIGAFTGSYSHIVLDAVMHRDMNPWWPLMQGNALLGVINTDSLHMACVVLGVVGAAVVAVKAIFKPLNKEEPL